MSSIAELQANLTDARNELGNVIVGQEEVLDALFISILITFSDLGPFISSEFDLVVLSDISLFTSLFLSKFSSIKKTIYSIIN